MFFLKYDSNFCIKANNENVVVYNLAVLQLGGRWIFCIHISSPY